MSKLNHLDHFCLPQAKIESTTVRFTWLEMATLGDLEAGGLCSVCIATGDFLFSLYDFTIFYIYMLRLWLFCWHSFVVFFVVTLMCDLNFSQPFWISVPAIFASKALPFSQNVDPFALRTSLRAARRRPGGTEGDRAEALRARRPDKEIGMIFRNRNRHGICEETVTFLWHFHHFRVRKTCLKQVTIKTSIPKHDIKTSNIKPF